MFWALLALLVLVPFLLRAASQRALTGNVPKALPGAPLGLHARLAGVDAAIEDVRAALGMMTTPAAMTSATLALRRLGAASGVPSTPSHALLPFAEPGETGPATQCFEALLRALLEIDEADVRDLVDAGADPARIVDAVGATADPDRWARNLLGALDYWQQTVARLRTATGYR